jgi:hypothetical protein
VSLILAKPRLNHLFQFRKKAKEENKGDVEWERTYRLRKSREAADKYITKCESLRNTYKQQAVEATRIGNDTLVKLYVSKVAAVDRQIKTAKSMKLLFDDFELGKEQFKLFTEMTQTVKDMAESFKEDEINQKSIMELTRNLDKALFEANKMDQMLQGAMESIDSSTLGVANVSQKDYDSVMSEIKNSAIKEELKQGDVPSSPVKEEEVDEKMKESLKKLKELKD